MITANLLEVLKKSRKTIGLKDLVLYGRVRCAIERPSVIGKDIQVSHRQPSRREPGRQDKSSRWLGADVSGCQSTYSRRGRPRGCRRRQDARMSAQTWAYKR